MEEGEILEEEGFGGRDGEVAKRQTESDAESGEIMVTGDRGIRSDKANLVGYDRIYFFLYRYCLLLAHLFGC